MSKTPDYQKGLDLALRVTMSPHEWTWTPEEQIEMARAFLRAMKQKADRMAEIKEMLEEIDRHLDLDVFCDKHIDLDELCQ